MFVCGCGRVDEEREIGRGTLRENDIDGQSDGTLEGMRLNEKQRVTRVKVFERHDYRHFFLYCYAVLLCSLS